MMYIASNGIKTAVIMQDSEPFSPRDPEYQENLTKMVCWHSRHSLGDDHDFDSPHAFANEMIRKYVSENDVLKALVNGELSDFRVTQDRLDGNYSVEGKLGLIPGHETWERMDFAITHDTFEPIEGEELFDLEMDVLSNCWPDELLRLCDKCGKVAVMPLHFYEHSGCSISTSSFVGRAHHAQWDSGQVGYIYLDKETTIKNMALAGDKISLAMAVPYAASQKISRDPADNLETTMTKSGYSVVHADDIKNIDKCRSDDPGDLIIHPDWAKNGLLFKKDHTLFVFEHFNPDNTLSILPVASFNPDLEHLTDEAWRARAEEAMVGDVKEYDNFLTGEIYGYKLYEGLDEIESTWGFNPGSEDIEKVMNAELCGWFGGKLNFEHELGYEDFDIEEYFENHDFPEVKEDIAKKVATLLYEDFQSQDPFPYAMSFADIRADKDDVLTDIVDQLYQEHEEPTVEKIREAIFEHAGVSREVQPKLSITDLEPGKEYTADELMQLLNKKPSLQDMIRHANNKQAVQSGNIPSIEKEDLGR